MMRSKGVWGERGLMPVMAPRLQGAAAVMRHQWGVMDPLRRRIMLAVLVLAALLATFTFLDVFVLGYPTLGLHRLLGMRFDLDDAPPPRVPSPALIVLYEHRGYRGRGVPLACNHYDLSQLLPFPTIGSAAVKDNVTVLLHLAPGQSGTMLQTQTSIPDLASIGRGFEGLRSVTLCDAIVDFGLETCPRGARWAMQGCRVRGRDGVQQREPDARTIEDGWAGGASQGTAGNGNVGGLRTKLWEEETPQADDTDEDASYDASTDASSLDGSSDDGSSYDVAPALGEGDGGLAAGGSAQGDWLLPQADTAGDGTSGKSPPAKGNLQGEGSAVAASGKGSRQAPDLEWCSRLKTPASYFYPLQGAPTRRSGTSVADTSGKGKGKAAAAVATAATQQEALASCFLMPGAKAPGARKGCVLPDSLAREAWQVPQASSSIKRVADVLSRARRLRRLSLVFVGGSATAGRGLASPTHRYPDQLAAALASLLAGPGDKQEKTLSGRVQVDKINIGRAGMSSLVAAFCLDRELAMDGYTNQRNDPELFVLELQQTDMWQGQAPPAMEGLLRRILNRASAPAILLLSMFPGPTFAKTPPVVVPSQLAWEQLGYVTSGQGGVGSDTSSLAGDSIGMGDLAQDAPPLMGPLVAASLRQLSVHYDVPLVDGMRPLECARGRRTRSALLHTLYGHKGRVVGVPPNALGHKYMAQLLQATLAGACQGSKVVREGPGNKAPTAGSVTTAKGKGGGAQGASEAGVEYVYRCSDKFYKQSKNAPAKEGPDADVDLHPHLPPPLLPSATLYSGEHGSLSPLCAMAWDVGQRRAAADFAHGLGVEHHIGSAGASSTMILRPASPRQWGWTLGPVRQQNDMTVGERGVRTLLSWLSDTDAGAGGSSAGIGAGGASGGKLGKSPGPQLSQASKGGSSSSGPSWSSNMGASTDSSPTPLTLCLPPLLGPNVHVLFGCDPEAVAYQGGFWVSLGSAPAAFVGVTDCLELGYKLGRIWGGRSSLPPVGVDEPAEGMAVEDGREVARGPGTVASRVHQDEEEEGGEGEEGGDENGSGWAQPAQGDRGSTGRVAERGAGKPLAWGRRRLMVADAGEGPAAAAACTGMGGQPLVVVRERGSKVDFIGVMGWVERPQALSRHRGQHG
eukprot:jgi/Mesvir1/14714/Mv05365-RA.1